MLINEYRQYKCHTIMTILDTAECDVEVISSGIFELEKLLEYITDDITVRKPDSVIVYRHLIKFLRISSARGKIYYLNGFDDDMLKEVHAGILKFTWENELK